MLPWSACRPHLIVDIEARRRARWSSADRILARPYARSVGVKGGGSGRHLVTWGGSEMRRGAACFVQGAAVARPERGHRYGQALGRLDIGVAFDVAQVQHLAV